MQQCQIAFDECSHFPGGWSYDPALIHAALSALQWSSKLRVLEFGAGQGTRLLVKLLERKIPSPGFEFVSYEDNPEWVCTHPKVQTILWSKTYPEILSGPYHLILIDGPRGSTTDRRLPWFTKIRPVVQPGTILVVDDFDRNSKYEKLLQENYVYEEVARRKLQVAGENNWIVVRVQQVRANV